MIEKKKHYVRKNIFQSYKLRGYRKGMLVSPSMRACSLVWVAGARLGTEVLVCQTSTRLPPPANTCAAPGATPSCRRNPSSS